MKKRTSGNWDPGDRPLFFNVCLASFIPRVKISALRGSRYFNLLFAVNELSGSDKIGAIDESDFKSAKILIDSGVFAVCSAHAKRHNCSLAEALAMPPSQVSGGDELLGAYLLTVGRFRDVCWGAIEVDSGGLANKRLTRRRIEDSGIVPIPVYHVDIDPPEYLPELLESYDRVAIGNIVRMENSARVRWAISAMPVFSSHPDTWVHILGFTPGGSWPALPVCHSADSSAFSANLQFGVPTDISGTGLMVRDSHGAFMYSTANGSVYDDQITMLLELGAAKSRNWRRLAEGHPEVLADGWWGKYHAVRP